MISAFQKYMLLWGYVQWCSGTLLETLANQIFLKKFFQKFLKFSEVSKFMSKNFLIFQKSMVFQKFFSEVYILNWNLLKFFYTAV